MKKLSSPLPRIIQGGMGIGVSNWKLARSVAELGQFGVVSGTAIDTVVVRELQLGDPHGRLDVLRSYPDQDVVEYLIDQFYVADGLDEGKPFKLLPIHRFKPTIKSQRILCAAAYSEVKLARQGHEGLVGMNLLTKLKRNSLAAIYGAMLADVDALMMGAGIPLEEIRQLDALAKGELARIRLDVDGAKRGDTYYYELDPANLHPAPPRLKRPAFLAIISSDVLARIMVKKLPEGAISGWIIESPVAGGHNAPPRNKQYDENQNPVYDDRDLPDLEVMKSIGLPFYLAGGYGTPEKLQEALAQGASGVQVGSLFSLANESGYPSEYKEWIIPAIHRGEVRVRTDGRVSSTGFPFKVVELNDTLAMPDVYAARRRICDLGYLQTPYVDDKGRLQGRCPSEPVETYVQKDGDRAETVGKTCICNGLMANIGLGQRLNNGTEKQLFTAGDEIEDLPLGSVDAPFFDARDVLEYMMP